MEFGLDGTAGYLQKASGVDYEDCRNQVPSVALEGDLFVGQRYYTAVKPPTRNWRIWRACLSFDTSWLGATKKSVRWATLAVPMSGAYIGGSDFQVQVWRLAPPGFGPSLDADDWFGPTGTQVFAGLVSRYRPVVRFALDPAAVNRFGATQFRLRSGRDPIDPTGLGTDPTGDEYITLQRGGIRLMIDTGNVNDDVCQNIADVLGSSEYAGDLTGVKIHPTLRATAPALPEIQVAWESTGTDPATGDQVITAVVYYFQAALTGPSATNPFSVDENPRRLADLIRRILLRDADCNGYCSSVESISEALAGEIYFNQNYYQGAAIRVSYRRPIGDTETI